MSGKTELAGGELLCTACQFTIRSTEVRATHYKGEWHRYNIKRRCAGLGPVTEELFDRKLGELRRIKYTESSTLDCKICNKTYQSLGAYEQHLTSKLHHKKASKKQQANSKKSKVAEQNSHVDPAGEEEKKEVACAEAGEEGGEAGGHEEIETPPVPPLHCLFCGKACNSTERLLIHMLKKHGFYIPFAEYLVDLEGLLEYLSAKVGMGRVCLYCNGRGKARYGSLAAVRAHMIDKSHCKLRIEDAEEEEDEFLDFYRFPSASPSAAPSLHQLLATVEDLREELAGLVERGDESGTQQQDELLDRIEALDVTIREEAGQDLEALTNTRRVLHRSVGVPRAAEAAGARLEDMNALGELVLSDGTMVGHRSLSKAYNQHARPTETRESVLLAQTMARFKAITHKGHMDVGTFNQFNKVVRRWHNRRSVNLQIKNNTTYRKRYKPQDNRLST